MDNRRNEKKSPQGFGGRLLSCGRPVTFLCRRQGCCTAVSPSLEIFFSRSSKIHSVDWNCPGSVQIDGEHWFWKANTGETPPAGEAMSYWQKRVGCYDIWSFPFLISQRRIPRLVRLLLNSLSAGPLSVVSPLLVLHIPELTFLFYFLLVFHISSILFPLFLPFVLQKISNVAYLPSLFLACFNEIGSRGRLNVYWADGWECMWEKSRKVELWCKNQKVWEGVDKSRGSTRVQGEEWWQTGPRRNREQGK